MDFGAWEGQRWADISADLDSLDRSDFNGYAAAAWRMRLLS
jgi:hypothetical protein